MLFFEAAARLARGLPYDPASYQSMIPRPHSLTGPGQPAISIRAEAAGRIRIWLVDDSKSFRLLLKELLGNEADLACERDFPSAEAALDALAQEQARPDVILLDIDMGGMSGLEALRPIKAMAGTTHVLMLTAFYDSGRKSQALRNGAADFLLKSYHPNRITERIRRAVNPALANASGPAELNRLGCHADGGSSAEGPIASAPPDCGRRNAARRVSGQLARGIGHLRAWLFALSRPGTYS